MTFLDLHQAIYAWCRQFPYLSEQSRLLVAETGYIEVAGHLLADWSSYDEGVKKVQQLMTVLAEA